MAFGFGGNKDNEQSPSKDEGRKPYASLESFGELPQSLIENLKDIGSSLHQAGCRFGIAADTTALDQQQTQKISHDKSHNSNNTETKTGGIERL